ncbi:DUF636 domain protein [Pleomassaria siparia CBS 279.74]|uniref:DUF636 domain protein n=1 Tax=Pleomassaria siparia CBS 279.74 TaxID=1314801 RepID=A0A6G1KMJ5_9PLEO|nr:DUF636 domain protein [Pleomassaria siparia CBS 279.74]
MSEGGCLCGAIRIRSSGEIKNRVICHCSDCRKITGSTYSTNIVVDADGFSVTKGTPKEYSKKADSGETVTSHFCGDCGSTLWRTTKTFGNTKVIRVGVMDGTSAIEDAKPAVELFVSERISWVPGIDGAGQKELQS